MGVLIDMYKYTSQNNGTIFKSRLTLNDPEGILNLSNLVFLIDWFWSVYWYDTKFFIP